MELYCCQAPCSDLFQTLALFKVCFWDSFSEFGIVVATPRYKAAVLVPVSNARRVRSIEGGCRKKKTKGGEY